MNEWTSEKIDALWDFSNPAETERKFRDLLAETGSPEVRTQIVRTLSLQRKFEEAQAELDLVPVEPGNCLLLSRRALEQGRILNSSGKPEEARPHFELALAAAERGGHEYYAVDAAHMVAITLSGDDALRANERALNMARMANDGRARKWRASLLNNLGWTYVELEQYDKAWEILAEAVPVREEMGALEPIRIAKYSVAFVERCMGRTEDALRQQDQLKAEGWIDAYNELERSRCLKALGRDDEARIAALKSKELFGDEWQHLDEAIRTDLEAAIQA